MIAHCQPGFPLKYFNLFCSLTSIPPPKRSRSASVTSEQPAPVEQPSPNPETLDVPEQPVPDPSDEEGLAPPAPPRGKRGGGSRKNARKNATPSIVDDNEGMTHRFAHASQVC